MPVDSQGVKKEISVVIPVYNGARYLAAAVRSVLDQTLPPREIIIVDDGSTDNSPAIIQELAARHPIAPYTRTNQGQAAARNFGVRQARGELIAFLDQDDIWYPNHLEELLRPFLEATYPELGWTYSTVDDIGAQGELYRLDVLADYDAVHPKRSLAQCLATEMFVIPSAVLVSKKALDEVGGFDERLAGYEDDDVFLRIFAQGFGNIFINKSLAQWRIHPQSCSWDPRMAASRLLYAQKLLATFEDDFVRNIRYRTDIVLPRFLHVYLAEIKRARLFGNRDYARRLCRDLAELYPSMTPYMRMKCRLLVFILLKLPLQGCLQPLTRLYWRLNRARH